MSKRRVPPKPPAQPKEPPRPYAIGYAPAALRDIEDLPRDLSERVERRIKALAAAPRGHGVRKLTARGGEYRVRIGDVRVLFTIDDEAREIIVGHVGPRDQAYR